MGSGTCGEGAEHVRAANALVWTCPPSPASSLAGVPSRQGRTTGPAGFSRLPVRTPPSGFREGRPEPLAEGKGS